MAELWEWVEVYILFQTAVMDESTAKNKNWGVGGCLHAFAISKSHRLSSEVLKSPYNRWDWNNGTPGEGAKPDTTRLLLFVDRSWDVSVCE